MKPPAISRGLKRGGQPADAQPPAHPFVCCVSGESKEVDYQLLTVTIITTIAQHILSSGASKVRARKGRRGGGEGAEERLKHSTTISRPKAANPKH